jgi:flavin-binding protein dodecin
VNRDAYRTEFSKARAEPARAFEGFSTFNDDSTAESFHEAVKAAAKAAANAAPEGSDPEWFEVTRVRILVGNPNVKVYGATITATGGR